MFHGLESFSKIWNGKNAIFGDFMVIVKVLVRVMVAALVKGNFDVIVTAISFMSVIAELDFKTLLGRFFLLLIIREQLIGSFNDQSAFECLDSKAHLKFQSTF